MKNLLFVTVTFLLLLLSSVQSVAQQGVSINTRGTAPDSNAILDVSSTTKGALFPRMTTVQRTAIPTPAIGLTVFDLDKKAYWYYTGTEWVEITTNKDGSSQDNDNSRVNEDWNTQGNSIAAGEFLGTTNNQPLVFKANGSERMRVAGNGNVGIGVLNPNELLEAGGSGRAFFGNGAGSSRAGLLIDGFEPNNASRIEAYNYAGAGSGRNLIINTSGGGFVGINNSNPHAPLQFNDTYANRKIVLSENTNDDHSFYGFGTELFGLRYQVAAPAANHIFYSAISSTSSRELMRITGSGRVGIGTAEVFENLEVGGDGRAFFGNGASVDRSGLLIDGVEPNNATRIEAYNYGGAGSGRNLIINTSGGGFVGINNSNPHAPLQFNNTDANRKIVLSETQNNDHQFYGLGTDFYGLRYQIAGSAYNHIFYSGINSTSSKELMRITGGGLVGIGTMDPSENLEVGGNGRAFFGDGASVDRSGLLIDGVEPDNASRIEAFNYAGGGAGRNLIINTSGGGNVGIGIATPAQKLHVNGNAVVSENLGIGNSNPHAPLQFANDERNRKIVLWQGPNNDHEFSGFGINNSILRYQVVNENVDHVFYAGTSPTTSKELIRITGSGRVGIGNSNPNAPLQFANATGNRKIVLWEVGNNDQQFYGFGINGGTLRYQISDTLNQHVFYAGVNGTTSQELMRIEGNGNVGIGTSTPTQKLDVMGSAAVSENLGIGVSNPSERLEVGENGRAFFGDGQGNARKGLLIDGIEDTNASRIEAYDYGIQEGRNLIINTAGGGNVGIGAQDPKERLEVGGNGRAFFGDGAGVNRTGLLIDGVDNGSASRIEAYNYDNTGGSGRDLIINTVGGGKVGIGTQVPTEKLHVAGNVKVDENVVVDEDVNVEGNVIVHENLIVGGDAILDGEITVDGEIINEPYIAPNLWEGFANEGSGYAPAGYYKDAENRVHLRGVLNYTDNGNNDVFINIFTLPQGYRPAYDQLFWCYSEFGVGDFTKIKVTDSGSVIFLSGPTFGAFSIDQISFRAEK